MNSAVTFILATFGIAALLALMIYVEAHGQQIRRWLKMPPETSDDILRGYEHPQLVEIVFQKTLAYEPTSVWTEVAGVSSVLDFGGGCGIHYKEARSSTVRWAVVETPAMVARAKELETDRLRFFSDIDEAANWLGSIDLLHSNGALQYAPDPPSTLIHLCRLRAKRMLWKRVALSRDAAKREVQSTRLSDNGPGRLRYLPRSLIEYEHTTILEQEFLAAHRGYDLAERGKDWFKFQIREDNYITRKI